VPEEYGEVTEEERRQSIQEALDRPDLWGSEEETHPQGSVSVPAALPTS
jgi:hypothetical protein